MNKYLLLAIVVIALIGATAAYAHKKRVDNDAMIMKEHEAMISSSPSASPESSEAMMMQKEKVQETMAMTKDAGAAVITYTTEADAQKLVSEHNKDVVYFFTACQAINKHLDTTEDLAKLGKNMVLVKVDYDTQKALKAKYNITHQTAFVRIDATGSVVKQAVLSTYDDVLSF